MVCALAYTLIYSPGNWSLLSVLCIRGLGQDCGGNSIADAVELPHSSAEPYASEVTVLHFLANDIVLVLILLKLYCNSGSRHKSSIVAFRFYHPWLAYISNQVKGLAHLSLLGNCNVSRPSVGLTHVTIRKYITLISDLLKSYQQSSLLYSSHDFYFPLLPRRSSWSQQKLANWAVEQNYQIKLWLCHWTVFFTYYTWSCNIQHQNCP